MSATALDLPDTIKPLDRRGLLAQLILKWSASPAIRTGEGAPLVAQSPAAALALADDLARLMDDMTTRQVPWEKLDGLVPENLDIYWQRALDFLKIAHQGWPLILKANNAIEPAERRDLLIAAEAERLRAATDGPVIIAGSTGSMPATAKLIATIAALPHGAAVLPGLDTDLDEASWQSLSGGEDETPIPAHPQFAMQALLARMELHRSDVMTLGAPSAAHRELLVSEALRPAASTDLWRQRLGDKEIAGENLRRARWRHNDRSRQRRRRSAGDRGRAARNTGNARQNRGAGDAGPRAGAPRRGGARPLERDVRRFRRRCADSHTGRRVRPPCSCCRA